METSFIDGVINGKLSMVTLEEDVLGAEKD